MNGTAGSKTILVLDGSTNSTLYNITTYKNTISSAVIDVNLDGIDEIVYDNGSFIFAYDIVNESLVWNISAPCSAFVMYAKTLYVDNDQVLDVALFYNDLFTYTLIYVVSGATGKYLWRSTHNGTYMFYFPMYLFAYHTTEPVLEDINGDGNRYY